MLCFTRRESSPKPRPLRWVGRPSDWAAWNQSRRCSSQCYTSIPAQTSATYCDDQLAPICSFSTTVMFHARILEDLHAALHISCVLYWTSYKLLLKTCFQFRAYRVLSIFLTPWLSNEPHRQGPMIQLRHILQVFGFESVNRQLFNLNFAFVFGQVTFYKIIKILNCS